jgi:DNA polymerase III epsilon subunit-like protein
LAAEVIPRFMEWVGSEDTVMVAHNANFDLGFMRVALMKLGLTLPKNPVVDSLFLSRRLLGDVPNHQLKTLVQYLDLESGEFHRALADSQHVKNLLKRLISIDSSLATWGALIESGCVLSFQGGEDFAPAPSSEILALVQAIKEAIAEGNFLSLMYKGYRFRNRIVKPMALIQSSGRYYLNAYCQYVEAERTFRLDKIGDLKVINSLQIET